MRKVSTKAAAETSGKPHEEKKGVRGRGLIATKEGAADARKALNRGDHFGVLEFIDAAERKLPRVDTVIRERAKRRKPATAN